MELAAIFEWVCRTAQCLETGYSDADGEAGFWNGVTTYNVPLTDREPEHPYMYVIG